MAHIMLKTKIGLSTLVHSTVTCNRGKKWYHIHMKRDRKSITYETEDSALDIKGPSDTFPNTIYFPQTY